MARPRSWLPWAALAGGLAFLLLALDVMSWHALQPLDDGIDTRMDDGRTATGLEHALFHLGDGEVAVTFVVLAATGMVVVRQFRRALLLTVAALAVGLAVDPVKSFFHVPYPGMGSLYYAFPSGHTIGATFTLGLTLFLFRRAVGAFLGRPIHAVWVFVPWVLLAVGVGISTLSCGCHWFIDVLGGWSLGGGLVAFVLWVDDLWSQALQVRAQARLSSGPLQQPIDVAPPADSPP